MTDFHETKVYITDLESAHRGLCEVLGPHRLGIVMPQSSWRAKLITALAAYKATRGGPKRAIDFRYALDAVRWWQWAFEMAAHNAEHGELSLHRYDQNGAISLGERRVESTSTTGPRLGVGPSSWPGYL